MTHTQLPLIPTNAPIIEPKTAQIVATLKEQGQDFEFYPTTPAIIDSLTTHLLAKAEQGQIKLSHYVKLMDIGAGNGNTLQAIEQALATKSQAIKEQAGKARTGYREESQSVYTHNIAYDGTKDDLISLDPLYKSNQDNPDSHYKVKPFVINHISLSAIEISPILYNLIDPSITLLGANVYEQNLRTIENDVIFCNPPFGDIKNFTVHIMSNLPHNCKGAYFVMPKSFEQGQAWQSLIDKEKAHESNLLAIVHSHNAKLGKESPNYHRYMSYLNQAFAYEIVGEFGFDDNTAERQARPACVLVYVQFAKLKNDDCDSDTLADMEFNDAFGKVLGDFERSYNDYLQKGKSNRDTPTDSERAKQTFELALQEQGEQAGFFETLADCFAKEHNRIVESYLKITSIDFDLLATLQVEVRNIKDSLKQKIKQNYIRHWKLLFERYTPLTAKLTSRSKDSLVDYVLKKEIPLTTANLQMVTVYAINNTNRLIKAQALDLYFTWANANKENRRPYKSNTKLFVENQFRRAMPNFFQAKTAFSEQEFNERLHNFSPHALEYRIVTTHYFMRDWQANNDLHSYSNKDAYNTLNDLLIVMSTFGYRHTTELGYPVSCLQNSICDFGKRYTEYGLTPDGEKCKLFEFKFFKNGNVHFFVNKQFMVDFMVFIGKELGWLHGKNPQEMADELDVKLTAIENANQITYVGQQNLPALF